MRDTGARLPACLRDGSVCEGLTTRIVHHAAQVLCLGAAFGATTCPSTINAVDDVPEGVLLLRYPCSARAVSEVAVDVRAHTTYSPTCPAGCPCNPASTINLGKCANGYVCADPWAKDLLSIGVPPAAAPQVPVPPINPGAVTAAAAAAAVPSPFTCQPCAYGQYCPRGSKLPPTTSALIQL